MTNFSTNAKGHNVDNTQVKVRCTYSSLVPIKELKALFHPKNRNKHPPEQLARLAQILEYQGARAPAKISKLSGRLTAGHGRVQAAELAGWSHYPVDYQDYESEEQEYADLQADNAIALWAELDLSGINADLPDLGPDFDLDLLGIKNFKIDVAEKEAEDPGAGGLPSMPRTKPGDLYKLGAHRLLCGDSTNSDDVAKLMGGGVMAELCFTSPPYADQREYNGGKELSTEHLATFIRTAFGSCRYFAVNLGYSRKDGEVNPYWDDYIKEAKSCGLKLLSWNVWDKGECGSIGNQTAMFGISHEWIFVFGPVPKDLNRTVQNKSAGARANHTGNRQSDGTIKKSKDRIVAEHSQLRTVYQCTAQKARDEIDHPARFPVGFAAGYIEAMTDHGDVVLEPFGGSGTTLIACEQLGRAARVMELDPRYCDVICERWRKMTGEEVYRLNDDGSQTAWTEIETSGGS